MPSPPKSLICLLLLITSINSQFECISNWLSDGNYYQIQQCVDGCVFANSAQNVTNLQTQSYDCCKPICERQVSYHRTKRIVIIIAASVIFFVVFACCFYGCFGPNIKEMYVLRKEYQSRKPVTIGMDPQEFNKYPEQFVSLFNENSDYKWVISFFVQEGIQISQQLTQVKLQHIKTYHYSLKMQGQDIKGLWNSSGYFTNTEKGPMIWGLKNYQNAQNTTIYFEKYCDNLYELVRNQQGNYEGVWYHRDHPQKQYPCTIKRSPKKFKQTFSQINSYNQGSQIL